MKCLSILSLTFVACLFTACSPRPQNRIAGSDWLGSEKGGSMYDVLAYPLYEDELVYFESALPALETLVSEHSALWQEVSSADEPIYAARENAFWKESGYLGEDVIALSLKLTFLQEFASTEEDVEADMRANLSWLEKRLAGDESKPELLETSNTLRALLLVIEAHRESGAFQFYAENRQRIDAALDRFISMGEQ